jgi:O-antigen ligase
VLFFVISVFLVFRIELNLWKIELSDFAMVAMLLVWLTRTRSRQKEKVMISRFKGIVQAFILFLVWCIFTQILALEMLNANSVMLMLSRTIKWFLYSLFFLLLITEFAGKSRSVVYIFNGFVFGLALQGVLVFFGITAKPIEEVKAEQNVYLHSKGYYRENAFGSQNPNMTGSIIACFLVFIIPNLLKRRIKKPDDVIPVLASYSIPVLVIISMIYSLYSGLSRGAFITLAFGLFFFYARNRRSVVTLLVIIGIGIFALNSKTIKSRFLYKEQLEGIRDQSFGGRIEIPTKALRTKINLKSLVIGNGYYSGFYSPSMWSYGAHNQYVQVLWETGIPGLFFLLHIFYQVWKYVRKVPAKEPRKLLSVIIATQIFTLIPGEFLYYAPYLAAQILLITYAILNLDDRLKLVHQIQPKIPLPSIEY